MSIFDGELIIEASSASGIEAVTKRELISLGYEAGGALEGRIRFRGDKRDVMRANVFLRTAGRVRIVLADFEAATFDELFDRTAEVVWREILPKNARVVVNAKSVKSTLFSLSSIQSIVKKAISVSLTSFYGIDKLPEDGCEYRIEAALYNNRVSLTLDTSGDGLHKRGYRIYLGEAPIRETTAAAMILLSVWNADRVLIDPFCGSGTIPIEAALIGSDTAPGLKRRFACECFPEFEGIADAVREEAEQLIDRNKKLRISGFDLNPEAIGLAVKHAGLADMRGAIHLQTADVKDLSSRFAHGVIVTNPPYGVRLSGETELRNLYRVFGERFASLEEWSAYVITAYAGFEKYFGRKADKIRRIYNSELECRLYRFLGKPPSKIDRVDRTDYKHKLEEDVKTE